LRGFASIKKPMPLLLVLIPRMMTSLHLKMKKKAIVKKKELVMRRKLTSSPCSPHALYEMHLCHSAIAMMLLNTQQEIAVQAEMRAVYS
jgi:hypothetical protein